MKGLPKSQTVVWELSGLFRCAKTTIDHLVDELTTELLKSQQNLEGNPFPDHNTFFDGLMLLHGLQRALLETNPGKDELMRAAWRTAVITASAPLAGNEGHLEIYSQRIADSAKLFEIPGCTKYSAVTKTVEAVAVSGPKCSVYKRIARHEGKIYVDLANDAQEVVEIGPDGWKTVSDSPVKFVRGPDTAPLPQPQKGGSLEDLRPFVNLTEDGFVKYVVALLDATKGHGDYMVVVTGGEQGSSKTTLSRLAVRLIDPRKLRDATDTSDVPGPPKDEQDLAATAWNYHLLAFDNLSRITDDMSDAYCRVATGGSLVKRKLYSDGDLARLTYCGPLWLNGITDVVKKGDLVNRSVFLQALRVENPKPINTFMTSFDEASPRSRS